MRRLRFLPSAMAVPLSLFAVSAHAYVGPGLGLGAIAVILGIVLSVLIALVAIVWYPIKRRMAARRKAANESSKTAPGEGA